MDFHARIGSSQPGIGSANLAITAQANSRHQK